MRYIRNTGKAIAFVLIFALLFHAVSGVMVRKTGGKYDLVRSFYHLEKDSLDILCLGSSHAYHSFQPNEMWNEYGMTSYVMGTPQQSIAATYFLLKEAFRFQKPKIVLVETYYFKLQEPYASEGRMRVVSDGMKSGSVKKEMLDELMPELGPKELLSWYVPFIAYHSRWQELGDHDFHTEYWYKGAKLSNKVEKDVTDFGLEGIEPREISDYTASYLDRICSLCRENGAELVLYTSPYGVGDEMKKNAFIKNQGLNMGIEIAAAERGIPYLYYQKRKDAGIDYSVDFSDTTHLNNSGARKCTLAIGSFLKSNYDMPDHRNDSAYDEWNADYEKYRKAITDESEEDAGSDI